MEFSECGLRKMAKNKNLKRKKKLSQADAVNLLTPSFIMI